MGKPTPSRYVNKIRHLIETAGNLREHAEIIKVYNEFKTKNKKVYTRTMRMATGDAAFELLRKSQKKYEAFDKLFDAGKYIIDTDVAELVTKHASKVATWQKHIEVYDAETERIKKEDEGFAKYFRKKPDKKPADKNKKKNGFFSKMKAAITGKLRF